MSDVKEHGVKERGMKKRGIKERDIKERGVRERNGGRRQLTANLLGFAAAVTLCLTAGFYAGSLFSNQWPPVAEYLISVYIGFLFCALAGIIFHELAKRKPPDRRERRRGTVIDALERVSRGDFNVFVESGAYMHNEFADAINEMARNLGTLETMRQDFISNVSHEIQSPLTSISGFAALLKKEDLPADERLRYAGIIETESRRLSSLSDHLLKLSSLDDNPLVKSEFRLDKQISDVILTLEPQWSAKKMTVEADLQARTLNGDRNLISEIWINLLHNAIKFTPENGTVRVSLNENSVTVTDTGIGMAKDDLPHIFERFYKTDKARDRALNGNGLGLSLAKKIVDMHGGVITVRSEPGKGTTFTVSLP
jgi:signal transduction histidine kinase